MSWAVGGGEGSEDGACGSAAFGEVGVGQADAAEVFDGLTCDGFLVALLFEPFELAEFFECRLVGGVVEGFGELGQADVGFLAEGDVVGGEEGRGFEEGDGVGGWCRGCGFLLVFFGDVGCG